MSEFTTVKYKDKKTTFEILCKPSTVLKYREGEIGIDKVLFADTVFKNYSKGEKPLKSELLDAFGTDNESQVIKTILDKGEYNLSTAERKEKVEKKRKEMVSYIHKYYTDPRTKTTHPVTRIESALSEIKLNIDPDTPAELQVNKIYSTLIEKLPLKKSEVEATVTIKHAFLGQTNAVIQKFCKIQRDNYTNEGREMLVTMVPGDYDVFTQELHKITKGDYEINITGAGAMMASTDEPATQKGKGGRGGKGKKK
ncbi:ribosome maturation protein SDO1 [Acrasis kona]|uniref:Ribosome maturation protein SDO1 n=1 Tax=Acrasis kona TaxID=1008807 RepID=A0AAW2YVV5_9EUKA